MLRAFHFGKKKATTLTFHWNPLDKSAGVTLSDGNLTATGSTWNTVRGTVSFASGKHYYELIENPKSQYGTMHGFASGSASLTAHIGSSHEGWGSYHYGNTGEQYHANAKVSGYGYAVNYSRFMVAVDMDSGKIWIGVDGTWHNLGDPVSGANPTFTDIDKSPLYPAISTGDGSSTLPTTLLYDPPAGYIGYVGG